MTVNYHFPESGGWGSGHRPQPESTGGSDRAGRDTPFCDLHLFHRHGKPARIVVVHHDPSYGSMTPVLTWLEVRSNVDAAAAAAAFVEVLGRSAAEAATPVRLYDHDPHGNIHSWLPHRPAELTRERVASDGRVQR